MPKNLSSPPRQLFQSTSALSSPQPSPAKLKSPAGSPVPHKSPLSAASTPVKASTPVAKNLFSNTKIGKKHASPLHLFKKGKTPTSESKLNSKSLKQFIKKSSSVNKFFKNIIKSPTKAANKGEQTPTSASAVPETPDFLKKASATLSTLDMTNTELTDFSFADASVADSDGEDTDDEFDGEDQFTDAERIIDQYGLASPGPFSPSKEPRRESLYKQQILQEKKLALNSTPSKSAANLFGGLMKKVSGTPAPEDLAAKIEQEVAVKTSPTKYATYIATNFGGSLVDSILSEYYDQDN